MVRLLAPSGPKGAVSSRRAQSSLSHLYLLLACTERSERALSGANVRRFVCPVNPRGFILSALAKGAMPWVSNLYLLRPVNPRGFTLSALAKGAMPSLLHVD